MKKLWRNWFFCFYAIGAAAFQAAPMEKKHIIKFFCMDFSWYRLEISFFLKHMHLYTLNIKGVGWVTHQLHLSSSLGLDQFKVKLSNVKTNNAIGLFHVFEGL